MSEPSDKPESKTETKTPEPVTTPVVTPADKGGEKTFTQADVERIIGERLDRAQKKAEADAKKQREEAEAADLVKRAEFEKLAESRQKKVEEQAAQLAEMEGIKAKTDRYEKALRAQLDTERARLPAHILTLLDKLDADEQLTYIAANRETLFAQAPETPAAKTPAKGTPLPKSKQTQPGQTGNEQTAKPLVQF